MASPAGSFPVTSTFEKKHASPAELDAALAEAKKEQSALIMAYGDVFGRVESSRSESQTRVWEDMMRAGFVRRPTAARCEAGIDPIATAHNEGKRMIVLTVMEAVHQAGVLARGGDHVAARKQSRKFKA